MLSQFVDNYTLIYAAMQHILFFTAPNHARQSWPGHSVSGYLLSNQQITQIPSISEGTP